MAKSIMELVAAAKAVVPAISPEQAAAIMGDDNVLVVDVRDDAEVSTTRSRPSATRRRSRKPTR